MCDVPVSTVFLIVSLGNSCGCFILSQEMLIPPLTFFFFFTLLERNAGGFLYIFSFVSNMFLLGDRSPFCECMGEKNICKYLCICIRNVGNKLEAEE